METTEHTQPREVDTAGLQVYANQLQEDIANRQEAIRELRREYGRNAKVNEDLRRRWVAEIDDLKKTLAQLQATHAQKREEMQHEIDTL